MIYALNESTGVLVGKFDTLAMAETYVEGILDHANFVYTYLEDINSMNYTSRIVSVDGIVIYNNKSFWVDKAHALVDNYTEHVVLDNLGEAVSKERFITEWRNNCTRLQSVIDSASQVQGNMTVGFEFIALFREECITLDLGGVTPLTIASKTEKLIPMLITGSFREAQYLLTTIEVDTFFTQERLDRYSAMLASADVIEYQ
jgi:hypothetical protein